MRRVRNFLEWFLDDSIREAVIGDLYELYDFENEQGKRFTSIRFCLRAVGFVRKSLYKKTVRFTTITEALVRSSLSTSRRRLYRHPLQAIGGFLGLTFGVICLSALVNYLVFNFSIDTSFSKSKSIHRIVMDVKMGDDERKVAVVPAALQESLVNSGITAARLRILDDFTLIQGETLFNSSKVFRASAEFTQLFDVSWKRKIHDQPLTEPNFIYVSESFFETLDKKSGALSLQTGDGETVLIGGVFYDFPKNSHIQPEVLLPIEEEKPQWMDWNWITYASAGISELERTVQIQYADHLKPQLSSRDAAISFQFQPLRQVYFAAPRDFDTALHGKKDMLLGMVMVAFFISCLIASNYLFQLLTRVQNRQKELLIRSTVGAQASQQRWVFNLEAGAELAAACLVAILLLWLNEDFLWLPALEAAEAAWVVIICFVLWLSSFIALRARRLLTSGDFSLTRNWGRFLLLWFQFTISIGLMAGIIIVSNQIQLLANMDPGYHREHVFDFVINQEETNSLEEAVTALNAFSGVEGVALSGQVPGSKPPVNGFDFKTSEGYKQQVVSQAWVSEGFFEVLGIPLLQGQPLSAQKPEAVVVNEQFLEMTGLTSRELINSPIHSGDDWTGTVSGVVKDFHFSSMDLMNEPMIYRYNEVGNHMLVRISTERDDLLPDLLFSLNQVNEFLISDYFSLDSVYAANYVQYEDQLGLLRLVTLLAFALSAMGLWASVWAYAIKRQKTLSIHKIHGAPVLKLWRMLFAPFLFVSLASIPIALYLAVVFGNSWLSSFPYRVNWPIRDWLVLIAGVQMMLSSALILRSRKIWAANPARILKTE